MSLSDTTIDFMLTECAKHEFLSKGYEQSSLRRICKEAGVTTGALYKRYNGKEELFSFLVGDTAEYLFSCMNAKYVLSTEPQTEAFLVKCWDMEKDTLLNWFRIIMEHKEAFTMLLCCSAGTKYQDFEHEFALSMSKSNFNFYKQAYEKGITRKIISEKDMHILDSAYWKVICEPFVHDYSWDEIVSIAEHVCSFMNYYDLLGIDKRLIKKYSKTDIKILQYTLTGD